MTLTRPFLEEVDGWTQSFILLMSEKKKADTAFVPNDR